MTPSEDEALRTFLKEQTDKGYISVATARLEPAGAISRAGFS